MKPRKDLEIYLADRNKPSYMGEAREVAKQLGLSKGYIKQFGHHAAILSYRMAIRAKVAEILRLPPPDALPSNKLDGCACCGYVVNSKAFRFCPSCGNRLIT